MLRKETDRQGGMERKVVSEGEESRVECSTAYHNTDMEIARHPHHHLPLFTSSSSSPPLYSSHPPHLPLVSSSLLYMNASSSHPSVHPPHHLLVYSPSSSPLYMNASYLSLSCSLHTRHTADDKSARLTCERQRHAGQDVRERVRGGI